MFVDTCHREISIPPVWFDDWQLVFVLPHPNWRGQLLRQTLGRDGTSRTMSSRTAAVICLRHAAQSHVRQWLRSLICCLYWRSPLAWSRLCNMARLGSHSRRPFRLDSSRNLPRPSPRIRIRRFARVFNSSYLNVVEARQNWVQEHGIVSLVVLLSEFFREDISELEIVSPAHALWKKKKILNTEILRDRNVNIMHTDSFYNRGIKLLPTNGDKSCIYTCKNKRGGMNEHYSIIPVLYCHLDLQFCWASCRSFRMFSKLA